MQATYFRIQWKDKARNHDTSTNLVWFSGKRQQTINYSIDGNVLSAKTATVKGIYTGDECRQRDNLRQTPDLTSAFRSGTRIPQSRS